MKVWTLEMVQNKGPSLISFEQVVLPTSLQPLRQALSPSQKNSKFFHSQQNYNHITNNQLMLPITFLLFMQNSSPQI
jgi:hypothetical protein